MHGAWKAPSCRGSATSALAIIVLLIISAPAWADDNGSVATESRDREYSAIARWVSSLEEEGNLLRRVVRLVRPGVVHIQATKSEGPSREFEETGSGVVIKLDERFFILTNRHVIHEAELRDIHIELADGRLLHPVEAWTDQETDVAIMAMDADNLAAVNQGNSDDVQIGDFVLAVGSPFGLNHSVTYGIISAKGRRNLELGTQGVRYQDFMQTDASINPGNSGGPLLNLRGEIVGINTAIASATGRNEGIGFSIPINMVMNVAEQLVENGVVRRAYLGVHLDATFDAEMASRLGLLRRRGARVTGITPDSPAAFADFRVNDVIVRFHGVPVEDDNHLINIVSTAPVGEVIAVEIIREGELSTMDVRVADRSQF